MKLLFDQNLSPRLVTCLDDLFPGSTHVQSVGLDLSPDRLVWEFARQNGFTIVSSDSDFSDLSAVLGQPPKVVWLRLGNCATADVAAALRKSEAQLREFARDDQWAVLALF